MKLTHFYEAGFCWMWSIFFTLINAGSSFQALWFLSSCIYNPDFYVLNLVAAYSSSFSFTKLFYPPILSLKSGCIYNLSEVVEFEIQLCCVGFHVNLAQFSTLTAIHN